MVWFWQSLLESMVDSAEGLCPHVMRKANLRQDLMKACVGKMVVPRSFVKDTLLEQSGIDIINKIRYVVRYLKCTYRKSSNCGWGFYLLRLHSAPACIRGRPLFLTYYTALQNVPKSSVDLNRPPQRSQVCNFFIFTAAKK